MPSFDIVCETDVQELRNAVEQTRKEIATRYDFKGTRAGIELDREGREITVVADDDYRLNAVLEILRARMARRKLDPKCLDYGRVEEAGGGMRRRRLAVKKGIDRELAKDIVKAVKQEKLKLQVSIQGDQVRVTGKKRDELQAAIARIKGMNVDRPLTFTNFRD